MIEISKATEPYESVWHYLRDSAIGFLLVIGGFVLAGIIAEALGRQHSLAYPFGLCIGMIPFLWFAQQCGIGDGDWIDYVAVVCFVLGMYFVCDALDADPIMLVPLGVCFRPIWDRFRGRKSEA